MTAKTSTERVVHQQLEQTMTGDEPTVKRLFADAIDAERLARGEDPKCEPTEKPVFDDDIEVLRFSCDVCGSKRWHWLGIRHVGETDYGDIEVDEYRCADCKTLAGW